MECSDLKPCTHRRPSFEQFAGPTLLQSTILRKLKDVSREFANNIPNAKSQTQTIKKHAFPVLSFGSSRGFSF